jgi:hypothetical protein
MLESFREFNWLKYTGTSLSYITDVVSDSIGHTNSDMVYPYTHADQLPWWALELISESIKGTGIDFNLLLSHEDTTWVEWGGVRIESALTKAVILFSQSLYKSESTIGLSVSLDDIEVNNLTTNDTNDTSEYYWVSRFQENYSDIVVSIPSSILSVNPLDAGYLLTKSSEYCTTNRNVFSNTQSIDGALYGYIDSPYAYSLSGDVYFINTRTSAFGVNSLSIGLGSMASGGSIAIGDDSFSYGYGSSVSRSDSVVMGTGVVFGREPFISTVQRNNSVISITYNGTDVITETSIDLTVISDDHMYNFTATFEMKGNLFVTDVSLIVGNVFTGNCTVLFNMPDNEVGYYHSTLIGKDTIDNTGDYVFQHKIGDVSFIKVGMSGLSVANSVLVNAYTATVVSSLGINSFNAAIDGSVDLRSGNSTIHIGETYTSFGAYLSYSPVGISVLDVLTYDSGSITFPATVLSGTSFSIDAPTVNISGGGIAVDKVNVDSFTVTPFEASSPASFSLRRITTDTTLLLRSTVDITLSSTDDYFSGSGFHPALGGQIFAQISASGNMATITNSASYRKAFGTNYGRVSIPYCPGNSSTLGSSGFTYCGTTPNIAIYDDNTREVYIGSHGSLHVTTSNGSTYVHRPTVHSDIYREAHIHFGTPSNTMEFDDSVVKRIGWKSDNATDPNITNSWLAGKDNFRLRMPAVIAGSATDKESYIYTPNVSNTAHKIPYFHCGTSGRGGANALDPSTVMDYMNIHLRYVNGMLHMEGYIHNIKKSGTYYTIFKLPRSFFGADAYSNATDDIGLNIELACDVEYGRYRQSIWMYDEPHVYITRVRDYHDKNTQIDRELTSFNNLKDLFLMEIHLPKQVIYQGNLGFKGGATSGWVTYRAVL